MGNGVMFHSPSHPSERQPLDPGRFGFDNRQSRSRHSYALGQYRSLRRGTFLARNYPSDKWEIHWGLFGHHCLWKRRPRDRSGQPRPSWFDGMSQTTPPVPPTRCSKREPVLPQRRFTRRAAFSVGIFGATPPISTSRGPRRCYGLRRRFDGCGFISVTITHDGVLKRSRLFDVTEGNI